MLPDLGRFQTQPLAGKNLICRRAYAIPPGKLPDLQIVPPGDGEEGIPWLYQVIGVGHASHP
ncbi:MAG: hypothetical protein P8178_12145, partial [Candidatus Thiodiazotropha sp.]